MIIRDATTNGGGRLGCPSHERALDLLNETLADKSAVETASWPECV
jgi:hypothetical protein